VAAVIQILSVNYIVFNGMPTAWLDLTYTASILRRHNITANASYRNSAPAKIIKRGVIFIRLGNDFRISKEGFVFIYYYVCALAVKLGNGVKREAIATGIQKIKAGAQRKAERKRKNKGD
jgi:hypothetical protein